jgi:hypothetical protein
MGSGESILFALAFHNVPFHIFDRRRSPHRPARGSVPYNATEGPPGTPRAEIPARCGLMAHDFRSGRSAHPSVQRIPCS